MFDMYVAVPGSPDYDWQDDFEPDDSEIFYKEVDKLDGLTVDEIWQRKTA